MEQGPESTDGAEGRRAHPFGLEESKSHGEEEEKEGHAAGDDLKRSFQFFERQSEGHSIKV